MIDWFYIFFSFIFRQSLIIIIIIIIIYMCVYVCVCVRVLRAAFRTQIDGNDLRQNEE